MDSQLSAKLLEGTDADVPGLASMLRILSDETRLRILLALAQGERDVTSLWISLRLPQARVSHHLAILRLAGVAAHRRAGKRVFYRLGPSARLIKPGGVRIECPHFALSLELPGSDALGTERP
jgi:DNA-binding transcriptional ArsR family regulator